MAQGARDAATAGPVKTGKPADPAGREQRTEPAKSVTERVNERLRQSGIDPSLSRQEQLMQLITQDPLQRAQEPAGPSSGQAATPAAPQPSAASQGPVGPSQGPAATPRPNVMQGQQPMTGRDRADVIPSEKDETMLEFMIRRAMATDVDDPIEFERLGTIMLGAMGGGAAGARVPGGPVPKAIGIAGGGVLGAAGGAVAPEATIEAMEAAGMLPEGTRERFFLSNEELQRVAAGEALLEAATFGLAAGMRAIGRGGGRLMTRQNRETQALADRAADQGLDLAPFQLGLGRYGFGRGVVTVLGRFPFVGGPARQTAQRTEEGIEALVQGMPDRLAPLMSSSDVSLAIYRDARGLFKKISGQFERRYETLFARADEWDAVVQPRQTLKVAKEVALNIANNVPRSEAGEAARASAANTKAMNFLRSNILSIGEQGARLGPMTLKQADELLASIDQTVSRVSDPKSRKALMRALLPVKGAIKADVQKNLVSETNPGKVKLLRDQLARIDADYAGTMAELFETATAKRFARFERGGLKGADVPSEMATQQSLSNLSSVVADVNDPIAMRELKNLVTKDTWNALGANVLSRGLEQAMKGRTSSGAKVLDANVLKRYFGFDQKNSTRREAMEVLLEGSPIEINDLRTITEAAEQMQGADIPNVSTFLARKAVIGSGEGLIRGALPFATFMGTGGAAGGTVGAAVAGLMFMGLGRSLVRVVSNPDTARSLHKVLDKEATNAARKAAYLRLARPMLAGMDELAGMTQEQIQQLSDTVQEKTQDLSASDRRSFAVNYLKLYRDTAEDIFGAIEDRQQRRGNAEPPNR